MKQTVFAVHGPSGFHAYRADGSLTSTHNLFDAARFNTREEAEQVKLNYIGGKVTEFDINEFAHRVRVINTSGHSLPKYAHEGDSGMDCVAAIAEPIKLERFERKLIPLGIFAEIPMGMEIQIRMKSGLANKYGLMIVNAPGTIDSHYRGELKANVINMGSEPYTIEPGAWICQIVLARVEKIKWHATDNLSETTRGENGHGSSGSGLN